MKFRFQLVFVELVPQLLQGRARVGPMLPGGIPVA
jgi:hypothetical protein